MQHLSLLTAGWSYIPAGLSFGYLLMLPIPVFEKFAVRIYGETMYWPFLVAIITLLISVALTNGLKLNYRKCQFVHLYVILAAMVLYLGAGLVFMLATDPGIPGVYLAACGLGLTLIPGLSYTHIRAPGRWRAVYMGGCYFWFLAGIAATATLFLNDANIWYAANSNVDETIHANFAICILVAACSVILLVAVNEMLQREGIVDYKKPLDFDTDIAHESGKLMGGRSERRNLYNNFTTTGPTTLGNGAAPKQWNSSTEQIIMGGVGSGKNYHNLWIFYMLFTKLQGFIAFYWIFVEGSVESTVLLFGNVYGYSVFWFMTAGSMLGILAMLVLSPKIVFVVASVLHTIGLILAVSFYCTGAGDVQMGVSFLVFYTFIGSSLVIPAINILELASLNFNESFLAIGSICELLGIALMQYFAVRDPTLFGTPDNHEEVMAAHFISMIVLSVILQVIVLWHMPNTYKKSLAEINSDLSRMTSYFAFSRMMVPISHHVDTTRTFAESVTSDQPEIEEKQLSTRNGHLVATRFDDQSDPTAERRSPYNDFSDTRYTRRTLVEREMSPVPDQDDPYLQEQLQRQHERNYILSRQQHYQHQARESPDSQQYNYQPERPSDLRQSRYIPDPEDYPHDRPRSNNSQHGRYNPPLLSRHQYYEEYNQGSRQLQQQQLQQRQPPVPLPKPVPTNRQPSSSPSDLQSQLSSVLRRSANPSATVKSEPGYVSRPRLQTQQSEAAPAPPPLPPADYLTKSLPRIKPDRKMSRESIHPVLIPKPPKPEEDIVPGVEYSHNLRPSEFLRQTRQSARYRVSAQPST